MAYLNSQEMREVAAVFKEAYEHLEKNYTEEPRTEIRRFVAHLTMVDKPYLHCTIEGVPKLVKRVFGEGELVGDFVLMLQNHFFSRWGESGEKVHALAQVLAEGVGQEPFGPLVATPKNLHDRLANVADTSELLRQNKWIMTILLISLFVSFVEPPKR